MENGRLLTRASHRGRARLHKNPEKLLFASHKAQQAQTFPWLKPINPMVNKLVSDTFSN